MLKESRKKTFIYLDSGLLFIGYSLFFIITSFLFLLTSKHKSVLRVCGSAKVDSNN